MDNQKDGQPSGDGHKNTGIAAAFKISAMKAYRRALTVHPDTIHTAGMIAVTYMRPFI